MNEVVRRLEQAGEVVRNPHVVDKRKIEYALTPTGRATVEASRSARRRLEERLASVWSSERQEALLDELRALNTDLAHAIERRATAPSDHS
jgi:DNA-binding MarR family transcriptional regulator